MGIVDTGRDNARSVSELVLGEASFLTVFVARMGTSKQGLGFSASSDNMQNRAFVQHDGKHRPQVVARQFAGVLTDVAVSWDYILTNTGVKQR